MKTDMNDETKKTLHEIAFISNYFRKEIASNEKTFDDYMYYCECFCINGRMQNQGGGTGGREFKGSELIESY